MDSKKNKTTWIIVIVILAILAGFYFYRDKLGFDQSMSAQTQQDQSTSSNDRFQMAPDITIKLTDGKQMTLADLKGKPVLLNFWSVDCPPCISEIKNIETTYKNFGKEAEIIGIATDRSSVDETLDVLHKNGGSYPLMVDSGNTAFAIFGIRATPTTIAINTKGEVVGVHTGYANEEQLAALIAKARA